MKDNSTITPFEGDAVCDVTISVRVPGWLAEATREGSKRFNVSISDVVRNALIQKFTLHGFVRLDLFGAARDVLISPPIPLHELPSAGADLDEVREYLARRDISFHCKVPAGEGV